MKTQECCDFHTRNRIILNYLKWKVLFLKRGLPQSQKHSNWRIHAHNVLKAAGEVALPYLLTGDALNALKLSITWL